MANISKSVKARGIYPRYYERDCGSIPARAAC